MDRFGEATFEVIDDDPNRLTEVAGIGFKTADKIARAVGIAHDAPKRLQAIVLHALGVRFNPQVAVVARLAACAAGLARRVPQWRRKGSSSRYRRVVRS